MIRTPFDKFLDGQLAFVIDKDTFQDFFKYLDEETNSSVYWGDGTYLLDYTPGEMYEKSISVSLDQSNLRRLVYCNAEWESLPKIVYHNLRNDKRGHYKIFGRGRN